jgi:hypothetical protein
MGRCWAEKDELYPMKKKREYIFAKPEQSYIYVYIYIHVRNIILCMLPEGEDHHCWTPVLKNEIIMTNLL